MSASLPQLSPGETLDRLSGDLWLFQLERGHRYNTDDVLTAWTAIGVRPAPTQLLDLGAGIGSVGLMVLCVAPTHARLTTVEVQPVSVALLRKSLAYNGLEARVTAHEADLRHVDLGGARFDLITANPPYVPPGAGNASPHPQRAAARLELHGDVFDYCATAARHLADDGHFVFCHAAADPRPEQAIAASGLQLLARRDVRFRADRAPALALFTCAWRGERRDEPPIDVRHADGTRTDAYRGVRQRMSIEHAEP